MALSLLRRLFRSIKKKSKRQQKQLTAPLPSPDILDLVAGNNDPIVIAEAVAVQFVSPPTGCRTITIAQRRLQPSELSASPPPPLSPRGTLTASSIVDSNSVSSLVRARRLPPRMPRNPSCPPIYCSVTAPALPYALAMRPLPALPQLRLQRQPMQNRWPLVDMGALRSPTRSLVPLPIAICTRNSCTGSANLPFRSRILLNSSSGNSSTHTSAPRLPVLAASPRTTQQQQQQRQRRILPIVPSRPSWNQTPRRTGRPHSMPTMRTTLTTSSTTSSKRTSTTFDEILASIQSPRASAGQTSETAVVPTRRRSLLLTFFLHRPSQPSATPPEPVAPPYELSADPAPAPVRPLWLSTSTPAPTPRTHRRRIVFNSREGHGLLLDLRRLLGLPADGMSSAETLLFVLRHPRVRQLAPPAAFQDGLIPRCNCICWQNLLDAMMHGREAAQQQQPARYRQGRHSALHPLARFSAKDCALVAGWITSGEPLFTARTAPTSLLLWQHRSLRSSSSSSSSISSAVATHRARHQVSAPGGTSRRARRHHTWAGHCPSPLSICVLNASEFL